MAKRKTRNQNQVVGWQGGGEGGTEEMVREDVINGRPVGRE